MMSWWRMGGYFMYVWPAYGLVFFALVGHWIALRRQKKRTHLRLQQWFQRARHETRT